MTGQFDLVPKPSSSLNWARRMALPFLAAAFLMMQSTGVFAQAEELLGNWQQLTSNAGSCPQCGIAFTGQGPRLKVAANNGWSADIDVGQTADALRATGKGQWQLRFEGKSVLTPLDVGFTLRGDRLHMTMIIEFAHGRKQIVKAVFGRIWSGV